jgi:hypothetical protein
MEAFGRPSGRGVGLAQSSPGQGALICLAISRGMSDEDPPDMDDRAGVGDAAILALLPGVGLAAGGRVAVGRDVGLGVGLGVGFGVAVGLGVGFGVTVGLGVGFGVALGAAPVGPQLSAKSTVHVYRPSAPRYAPTPMESQDEPRMFVR